jgi:transcriptional regulator with GAF, ATPase, and Fis domain
MRRPVLRDPGDLSALVEVSQSLGSTLNLRASLSHVLEVLEKSHGTHSGSVVLRDEEAGDLAVEAAAGRGAEMAARTRYRLGEGITGRVVQSGRPVVVPRVSREPLFLNKTRVFKSGGELSFVCVPIKADARTVGALGVTLPFAQDRGFDQETKFFGIVGSMIGQAVRVHKLIEGERRRLQDENTKLRQELQRRAEREEHAREAGQVGRQAPGRRGAVGPARPAEAPPASEIERGERPDDEDNRGAPVPGPGHLEEEIPQSGRRHSYRRRRDQASGPVRSLPR